MHVQSGVWLSYRGGPMMLARTRRDTVGGEVGSGWPASSQAIASSMATTGARWAAYRASSVPIMASSRRRLSRVKPHAYQNV